MKTQQQHGATRCAASQHEKTCTATTERPLWRCHQKQPLPQITAACLPACLRARLCCGHVLGSTPSSSFVSSNTYQLMPAAGASLIRLGSRPCVHQHSSSQGMHGATRKGSDSHPQHASAVCLGCSVRTKAVCRP